jgi:hypothetical protein
MPPKSEPQAKVIAWRLARTHNPCGRSQDAIPCSFPPLDGSTRLVLRIRRRCLESVPQERNFGNHGRPNCGGQMVANEERAGPGAVGRQLGMRNVPHRQGGDASDHTDAARRSSRRGRGNSAQPRNTDRQTGPLSLGIRRVARTRFRTARKRLRRNLSGHSESRTKDKLTFIRTTARITRVALAFIGRCSRLP